MKLTENVIINTQEYERLRNFEIKHNKEIMTRNETAEFLTISVRTLDNLTYARKIPFKKLNRRILFSRSALDEWIKADSN